MIRLAAVWLTVLALLPAMAGAAPPARTDGFVARLTLDGPIGPAAAEYVQQGLARAQRAGAQAVILQMDTPGGLASSMHGIVSDIFAAPLPVLGYVAPEGARAASAGTYILYACQIAAMAPATHLGAATPVALGGDTPMPSLPGADHAPAGASSMQKKAGGDAEQHKVLNDAIAYIRSLAELRGRNADWAEAAVRGAATLTATQAVQKKVVDFVAADTAALLRQASGRAVRVDGQMRTLALAGLPVRDDRPDWRIRFLSVITNPTVAYLLLIAGVWGLLLEAFHPGAMLPGIVGAICLLIGAYAMQLLPVNYAGLALMVLGLGLIVAEAVTPTIGAFGAGGVIAFVLGSVLLMNTGVPGYQINLGVILGVATAAAGLLALVLTLLMRSRRRRVTTGQEQMLGAPGVAVGAIVGRGWARVHGELWRVTAAQPLADGAPLRVVARDGLTLAVEPANGNKTRAQTPGE